jgi:hypothetical protein
MSYIINTLEIIFKNKIIIRAIHKHYFKICTQTTQNSIMSLRIMITNKRKIVRLNSIIKIFLN